MAFPYLEVFGILLVAYMGYSVWEQLDPRYPIGAGLVLLVATAVTDSVGAPSSADVLAEYVFLLLGAGVILLLVEQVRPRRTTLRTPLVGGPADPEEHATDPSEERDLPPQQPLDHLQQQPVALVHAPGDHDDQKEQPRDGEGQDRQDVPG
jgi:hypothetical protein